MALICEDQPLKRGPIDSDYVQSTIHGSFDDILTKKESIELKDILKKRSNSDKQVIVLIEGAPGSGKTTLSAHIFQEWGKRKLFQQYKAVIPLSLRHPVVQNASTIHEMLSVRSDLLSEGDIMKICKSNGQDVLLVLDGWDELPKHKRNCESFIRRLLNNVPGQQIFHKCSIIVTSRPISSCILHPIVSTRIEILGFTKKELKEFFTESLKGDTEAMKVLMERIQEHPEVASCCYLPLNASILVHLYIKNGYTIPTSLYGIFHDLVVTCISRHCHKNDCQLKIESFDSLPADVYTPFMVLCELAFRGIQEECFTFTMSSSFVTLGLLQGVESLSMRDTEVYYNFNHLVIQELLSAYFVSKQKEDDQVSIFLDLLQVDHRRFISVLQFYAAITNLQNPGVKNAVLKFVHENTTYTSSVEQKQILLFLLHCLYDVQNTQLMSSVLKNLENFGLNFGRWRSAVALTPVDSLYTGQFLSCVCTSKIEAYSFTVSMINCGMNDLGCEFLVRGMRQCLNSEIKTPLNLNLGLNNNISAKGVMHLCPLLETRCLNQLHLSRTGNLSDEGALYLAKGLAHNSSLTRLVISVCGFTSKGAKHIADALKINSCLARLDIRYNRLYDEGAIYFAEALVVNKTLTELELENCGITDDGMKELARSLEVNSSLSKLLVSNDLDGPKIFEDTRGFPLNKLTADGVFAFTKSLQVNVALKLFQIPLKPEIAETMQKSVNEVRSAHGFQIIEVKSRYYSE